MKKVTSVRLEDDLLENLKKQAKVEMRSLNNLIESTLSKAVIVWNKEKNKQA